MGMNCLTQRSEWSAGRQVVAERCLVCQKAKGQIEKGQVQAILVNMVSVAGHSHPDSLLISGLGRQTRSKFSVLQTEDESG